jgi:hypothetical protein
MSGYGYQKRQDNPPRLVPATGTRTDETPSRVRAPRSSEARQHPGTLDPEIFGDLEKIQETVITPEAVTTPEVMAQVVTALEGQFESLSALSANMGELTAGLVRDEDDRIRLDMDNAVLTVRDEFNTTRVVWGRLGSGAADYGIAVYDPLGSLILGANGLGTNVVGNDQVEDNAITNAKVANLDAAKINTGFINTARIENASIGDAKIANLAANKILAGALGVGRFIESVGYSAGSSGWRINAGGDAEFNNVTIRGNLDGVGGTFSGTLQAVGGTFSGTLQAVGGTFDTITAGLLQHSTDRFLNLSATGGQPILKIDEIELRADGTRTWSDDILNPPMLLFASAGGFLLSGPTRTRYTVGWNVNSLANTTDHRIRISYYRNGERVGQQAGIAIDSSPHTHDIDGGASGQEIYCVVTLTDVGGNGLHSIETMAEELAT